MKTLKEIREQTLNEDKKWSWDAKDAPNIDDLIKPGGIEMVKVSLDFGDYGIAGSFTESAYHYMGGVNLDNSGLYFDEGVSNKSGKNEYDNKPLRKKYHALGFEEGHKLMNDEGYTWVHIGGPTKNVHEFLTLKGSRAWEWLRQIPSRNLKRAISDVKRNRKFTDIQ